MKSIGFIVTTLILTSLTFAGPTLQQRANADLNRPDTTTATIKERIQQGIKQIAQDCANGTITVNDTFISNHAIVSPGQLIDWQNRALRGSMDIYMVSMIYDDPRLANGTGWVNSTDTQIRNAVKQCMWPWLKLIGTPYF